MGCRSYKVGILYTELDLHVGSVDFSVAVLLAEMSKRMSEHIAKQAMPETEVRFLIRARDT